MVLFGVTGKVQDVKKTKSTTEQEWITVTTVLHILAISASPLSCRYYCLYCLEVSLTPVKVLVRVCQTP